MNRADFLSRVPLFALLKREELEGLAEQTEEHRVEAGTVIIREGDLDRRMFMIISGRASVVIGLGSPRERTLVELGACGYFGEMALIDDLVRSASVLALEETRLLSLQAGTLLDSIGSYPSLAMELLQTMSRRVRALEKSLMSTLGGVLPICANCKQIRDEGGSWVPIEVFIRDRSDAEFSHGICPRCREILY
ncbi:MAG: cyclic nucleotide-binding domain-containing protein [Deltaproteobacteria bacterium]|nr:cyclic nucleotide-binding domain-containing protein [Deltaproteobacteria bacterium]